VNTDILGSIDGALRDFETSADAMRWLPGEKRAPSPAGEHVHNPLAVALTVDVEEFARSLNELIDALARAFRPVSEDTARQFHSLAAALFPARHRRCRTCQPGWKPLAVDGREYHRRQQARRKRKR
jgi:hypothetical protein